MYIKPVYWPLPVYLTLIDCCYLGIFEKIRYVNLMCDPRSAPGWEPLYQSTGDCIPHSLYRTKRLVMFTKSPERSQFRALLDDFVDFAFADARRYQSGQGHEKERLFAQTIHRQFFRICSPDRCLCKNKYAQVINKDEFAQFEHRIAPTTALFGKIAGDEEQTKKLHVKTPVNTDNSPLNSDTGSQFCSFRYDTISSTWFALTQDEWLW